MKSFGQRYKEAQERNKEKIKLLKKESGVVHKVFKYGYGLMSLALGLRLIDKIRK